MPDIAKEGHMSIKSFHLRNLWRVVWAICLVPLYLIGRLIPRNPRLWVFGNRHGFIDNARYLFEYVSRELGDIQAVWLCSDRETLDEVRSLGYEAVLKWEPRGLYVAFRAGVGIVCNGLGDLNRAAVGGMKIVQLWHGNPFKRFLLDYPADYSLSQGILGKYLNRISRWMLYRACQEYDLITAASEVTLDVFKRAFGVPSEKVKLTGFARMDVILSPELNDDVVKCRWKAEIGVPASSKLCLYAPTYHSTYDWLQEFDPERWDILLKSYDCYLLVKPHPMLADGNVFKRMKEAERVLFLDKQKCPDINKILPHIDILITDYSSVAFDFAALGKPIIFFAPDHDKYVNTRGFVVPYHSITCGTHCLRWEDLELALTRCLKGDDETYLKISKMLRERYIHYQDTNNCARIASAIKELLNKAL
jgi:CDP-glycerol glycerophosphotransferase (TagB/SpsB family)